MDSDLTGKGQWPLVPGTPESRPIPAGSGPAPGPRGAGQGLGGANRPIPLKPRAGGQLPEADDEDEAAEDDDSLREILRNAPAWLVSTVFHMLLLVVLGLLAVSSERIPDDLQVEASYSDPSDPLGSQLDDPTVLEGDATPLEDAAKEQLITPRDLTPVDDPLAAPLEIGDLKLGPGAVTGPATIEGAPIGLALKGRQIGSRNVLLGKYGGTNATEAAVEMGLAWLAKQQRSDGHWSLTGPYADGSQTGENIVAATAMALLAYQGHGDTHRDGKYSKNVARGWAALLKLQRKDGVFSGTMASRNELLYAHAQATIALCELYGMTQDSAYRAAAARAIAYAVDVQDKNLGGWRYVPREDSDTSVTGWFVMALQSARMAGLKVPEETLKRASAYLDRAEIDGGRRYGYWQANQPTNAVTAEGLLCRQYLGWPQDDPRLIEGVSALNKYPIAYAEVASPPGAPQVEQDVYYWYYATQAAHHMEGQIWDEWNRVMREQVPTHQVNTGPEAGSWNPQSDKWGAAGGRLYVTCLSIYMLEVYYRHLPIYSGYRALAGAAPAERPPAEPKAAPENDAKTEPDEPAAPETSDTAAEKP